MKTARGALLGLVCACAFSMQGLAQQSHDEVYLKDGSLIVGTIVELKQNVSVSVRTPEGAVRLIAWEFVEKIVAREAGAPAEQKRPAPRTEVWYIAFGLGYAVNGYPAELQSVLDDLKARPDASHTPVAIDFGLYLPLRDERTLVGCALTGSADRYKYTGAAVLGSSGESAQITQLLFSVSAMHFLGEIVGDGFFVRADAGFASADSELFAGRKDGIGFLLDGGYGIPVSDETRVLAQVGYSYRRMGGGNYSTLSLSVRGLF